MMQYRPDVDGLRAVAILFVLFFHAGLSIFPSGFIGVDIFFVISGFLITGIIHQGLLNNSFSFMAFYNRRLWRLQPVFISVLVITALVALLFYLPEDLVVYFKSARKSAVFLANTYFERMTSGYFAPGNDQLPLLHTWSLSIEWQCYLMLPLAFYALHKLVGKNHFSKCIYGFTLLFMLLTVYYSIHCPEKNYYQLGSRIFEFLLGSCVALHQKQHRVHNYVANGACVLAVAGLFYIAMQSNLSVGFPNIYALALCAATATLLFFGQQHPKPFATQCLATKPMVFIGLISYSLYIWHWPVFVFAKYMHLEVSLYVWGLVFLLAYLSWRFIEKPSRQLKSLPFGYSLISLVIAPVLVFSLAEYVVKKQDGYPQRFAEIEHINTVLKETTYPQRALCIADRQAEIREDCLLGAKKPPYKTAFMIGDSHSNHYWGLMDTFAKKAHVSVLAHATAACLTLPGLVQKDWRAKDYVGCAEQTKDYFKRIAANHYDFVIIGQNWSGYAEKVIFTPPKDGAAVSAQERIEQSLTIALQRIVNAGSRPVLIKSMATTDNNVYECFNAHIKKREPYNAALCNFTRKAGAEKWENGLFARMKNKFPQLILIDPKKGQCPHALCKVEINNVPVYRDTGHITDYASTHFATQYLQKHKNPLIRNG